MTGLGNATVYVVVTPRKGGDDTDDLEVLSSPPRWERLPGQECYVANINGGDSVLWDGWHLNTRSAEEVLDEVDRMVHDGLLERTDDGNLRLTEQGHRLADAEEEEDEEYPQECPVHGITAVVAHLDGAPSMTGSGFDPDAYDLACGHRLSWDPFTGKPFVTDTPR